MKKKIFLSFLVLFISAGSVLIANAQNLGNYWSSAFNTTEKLIPNCSNRREFNPYMNQYTTNQVCHPYVAHINNQNNRTAYTGDNIYYQQPRYQQPRIIQHPFRDYSHYSSPGYMGYLYEMLDYSQETLYNSNLSLGNYNNYYNNYNLGDEGYVGYGLEDVYSPSWGSNYGYLSEDIGSPQGLSLSEGYMDENIYSQLGSYGYGNEDLSNYSLIPWEGGSSGYLNEDIYDYSNVDTGTYLNEDVNGYANEDIGI